MSSRSVASLAIFVALVAAVGFALSGVPNVELMSLLTFASGAVLGPARGAFCGAAAMAFYSGFNPYGVAPPPTFATQLVGAAILGGVGGLATRGDWFGRLHLAKQVAVGAVLGAGLTLIYDVVTNFGVAWSMGAWNDPWPFIVAGLLFSLLHLGSNAVLFAIGLPPLLGVVRRRKASRW